jgi:acetyl esterase/lipase
LSLKENSQDIPLIQHPNHIHDVGKAITYLHNKYQKPIYLVGHSAGAHIALMLLLDTQLRYHSYVHGVLGVSGIYDIPLLVKTYPSYLEFITQAFGHDHNRYFDASPVSKVSEALDHKPIVIAQSPADSLVNNEQAEVMYRHIKGFHENVILDMSLKGDHYEIMNTENLIDAVKQMLNA